MDTIFYLVWRNCYIRAQIRNKVCQDLVIKINNLKELQDNVQFLSLFTDRDKIDNNIYIRLKIKNNDQLNQYIGNSGEFKLVNDLESSFYSPFSNAVLENMLLNHLPTSLRKLTLPEYYHIKTTTRIELPATLEDLDCKAWSISSLKKLIVPQNRDYKGCQAYVNSMDDLKWVQNQQWISNLYMDHTATLNLTPGMIPSQIKELYFYHNGTVEDQNIFPRNLTKLVYSSTVPINRIVVPQQLIYLDLNNFNQQLDKYMLPSTLETLIMDDYNSPLLTDVLPSLLKQLYIPMFNQELKVGVLPQSLKDLSLQSFKQEFKPFVLPSNLTKLCLDTFTGDIIANTLPRSLTSLDFISFGGSLEHAPQMNHLSVLKIRRLDQSVATMISNTNKIKISTISIDQDFNIQQSSIQHLELTKISSPIPLTSNLVPNQIKTLKLCGIKIQSQGLIPTTCTKLITDIKEYLD